tara:strand:+ start:1229 stop:1927 length:699 start_codon:yes stop_codon:yes gene_type:complete
MKNSILFALMIFISSSTVCQTSLSGIEVVEKSIKYHDPKGKLASSSWIMNYKDNSHFKFNPNSFDFEVKRVIKNQDVILQMNGDEFSAKVNGSTDLKKSAIEEKYTSEERGIMMRDYYQYLWTLPMKLKDEGTIIHDKVKTKDFFGKVSIEVRVTYMPEVGEDIWYFYFHPETMALHGYRFYHDESVNDGEYILLDGEVSIKDVKIPQTRKWYTHKEKKFLGEDILLNLTFK